MILRFDTVIAWQRISQLTMETGEQRTYYLAPLPHRALLVLRNGVTLETARNAVVDVAVGMDRADPGFAHDPGIVQLKITVVHRFSTVAERTQFLVQLPPGRTPQAASAAHPLVRKALRYAVQLKSEWPIAV